MLNPVAAVLSTKTLKTPHCSDVGADELVAATMVAVATGVGVAATGVAPHAAHPRPNNQIAKALRRIVADRISPPHRLMTNLS